MEPSVYERRMLPILSGSSSPRCRLRQPTKGRVGESDAGCPQRGFGDVCGHCGVRCQLLEASSITGPIASDGGPHRIYDRHNTRSLLATRAIAHARILWHIPAINETRGGKHGVHWPCTMPPTYVAGASSCQRSLDCPQSSQQTRAYQTTAPGSPSLPQQFASERCQSDD
jgi:hypothetical protein